MTYILGNGPLSEGKRLSVEVSAASDGSYIDLVVANGKGTVATVSLSLTMDGDLVLHAEDRTTPSTPGSCEPDCPVEREVIVTGAAGAAPFEPLDNDFKNREG